MNKINDSGLIFRKSIYFFLLIVLIAFYFMVPLTMDKTLILILLLVVLFELILFARRKEQIIAIKGQFLKHSTLVLIGFSIVHFQYYIDLLLGNSSEDNFFIWVNKAIVLKSLVLSVIGLTSFLLGYLIYKRTSENKRVIKEKSYNVKGLNLIATISLIIYFATVNRLYLAGFYGAEQMGAEATYAILIFNVLVFAILIQNCRNMVVNKNIPKNLKDYMGRQGIYFTAILCIYLASVMISGDRGPIITLGLAYFSGYYIVTRKKLNWKVGGILVIAGAAFITLLGIVRSMDKDLDFSAKFAEGLQNFDNGQATSFLPQTQELASSVRSLNITVNYIPSRHDYLYGRFQFEQLVVVIPFASIFNKIIFNDNSYKFNSSSSFVTWINQGNNPSWGEGTTCIADFYFDFGLAGVIIGMFIFGYSMRFAEVNTYSNRLPGLFIHSFVVVYLSYALYISRSSFLFNFRTVVWVFLALLINKYLFNNK